jgi:nucleoside-diphosphate-sugar epimerase
MRRSLSATAELAAVGIQSVVADITSTEGLRQIPPSFDWVVNTVASSLGGGVEEYRRTYLEGTRNLLTWLKDAPPQKFAYTSSTGVYGQDDGGWVDEGSAAEPQSPTARVLVETEQELLQAVGQRGLPAMILRLAGIYGPGRSYWLRQLMCGKARVPGEGMRWMNMVHRDDIVGAVQAALERGQSGGIYNVCDNEPVRHLDFFRWLAPRLDRQVPSFAEEDSSTRLKRGLTNKRVSNRKLREELGYAPKYPSYREGYGHLIRELIEPGE